MTELEQNPGKSGNFVIAVPIDDETSPLAPDVSSPAAKTRLKGSGKRRPRPWFWIGLLFYFLLLLGIGTFVLFSLSRFLTRYEAGTPSAAVNRYLELLRTGDFDTIYAESGFKPTAFTGKSEYIAYLRELYREPENLHTVEKIIDSDTQKQYIVYRGDERIGVLHLTPNPADGRTAWTVRTELAYLEPYTYTVSPKLDLWINGVDIASSGLTGEEVQTEYYTGIEEYTAAPSLQRYRVEGLLLPPKAEAFTSVGVPVPLCPDPNTTNAFTVCGEVLPEEKTEMLALAEKVAKTYSEYLSKDASKQDALAHIYKDSSFYKAVAGYSNYWFGTHSSHSFENFQLYGLTSYSPDDFTVEASFDYVVKYYKTRRYPTHYTMTFLRIDGRWQLIHLMADDKTLEGGVDPAG